MILMDISFVVLYLLFPIFCCVLLRTAGLSIFHLSIPSIAIISLFIFGYIGILPLYFHLDEYRYDIGINDRNIILQIFIYISISIIGIILGCYVSHIVLKNTSKIVIRNQSFELKKMGKIAILILIICSITALILYLKKIPRIALFVSITRGVQEGAVARSIMGNAFTGKYHRYSVFMHDVLNIATFTLFSHFLMANKKNIFISLLFVISVCLAVFTSIMSAEKGPIVFLFLGYWFVYLLLKKKGFIPVKNLFNMAFLFMFILVIAYIYFMGSSSIIKAISSIFSRSFTGQVAPAYFYLEYFPTHQDYLMGRSFPNPGGLMPYTPFQLTREVMDWKFPEFSSMGIAGSAPTAFWGEMYANFGLIGVCLPSVFVGIYLYIINYSFCKTRIKRNPFVIGLYVWFIFHYINLAMGGLSSFIIDFKLIVVLFVYCIVLFISGNGKIEFLKKRI